MKSSIKISRLFTAEDWMQLRGELIQGQKPWEQAVCMFKDRIESRFFSPMDEILKIGKNEGEGFSMALIGVVLLEFLAAFEWGKLYVVRESQRSPNQKNEQNIGLAPHQYDSGKYLLNKFLRHSNIFKDDFDDDEQVNNFYSNIRCGLVHEGRTLKNDVIISEVSVKNTKRGHMYFKDDEENRLNRDVLFARLKEQVKKFCNDLQHDRDNSRNNFILKMDEISGEEHVWYFIYGSNLKEDRIKERLMFFGDRYLAKKRCVLMEYEFVYNKRSSDGSAKANIQKKSGAVVEGIAVLLLKSTINKFFEKYEKGYVQEEVNIKQVRNSSQPSHSNFKAVTCISELLTNTPPSADYVNTILEGAAERNLPQAYVERYLKVTI